MDNNELKEKSYTLARSILGNDDFITPEEIAEARKLIYNEKQIKFFLETLPAEEVLRWCRDNCFILVAGPPSPMSLLDIRNLNSNMFYSETRGWYSEEAQNFFREDVIRTDWFMLRKTLVPNSRNKVWIEQQELLSKEEYIPNAPEVAWGITTYKEVRNIYLLHDVFPRTSSFDSDGRPVDVGGFGDMGIRVGFFWDVSRFDCLGVVSARKQN